MSENFIVKINRIGLFFEVLTINNGYKKTVTLLQRFLVFFLFKLFFSRWVL
jgi:hypothetical protein